jgi:indole-3-glycerol phosphate synthase
MNILEEIIAHKRSEIRQRKTVLDSSAFEHNPLFSRNCLSLKKHLEDPHKTGIIAEFKRKSPSKGIINGNADLAAITQAYSRHGASGLSILTDEHFFGGSTEDVINARFNEIPILRKDFIIDEFQLLEARAMGADVILLIASCLTASELRNLAITAKQLGLEVLLEVHNNEELDRICDEVDLVGVNNRDLKTFTVDVERSIELAVRIPSDKIKIAESGISNVQTICRLKEYGYKGFLIGENFMKEADPAIAFASFVNQLKKEMHEGKSMRNDAT